MRICVDLAAAPLLTNPMLCKSIHTNYDAYLRCFSDNTIAYKPLCYAMRCYAYAMLCKSVHTNSDAYLPCFSVNTLANKPLCYAMLCKSMEAAVDATATPIRYSHTNSDAYLRCFSDNTFAYKPLCYAMLCKSMEAAVDATVTSIRYSPIMTRIRVALATTPLPTTDAMRCYVNQWKQL